MSRWHRDAHVSLVLRLLAMVVFVAVCTASVSSAFGARPVRRPPRPAYRGPIHQFLFSSGVPIDSRIQVAKVSAVLKTRFQVRSVVKIIGRESLPNPEALKHGKPVRFDLGKSPAELELMRQNILSGQVIEFHPSEKLGELELFFAENVSLKIEIGYDMFYIRIGNRDCTFESSALRRQLKEILEPREVRSGGTTTSGSGRSRTSR